MAWILNELSLEEQFQDTESFKKYIEQLLNVRQKQQNLTAQFLCARTLGQIKITPSQDFQTIVTTAFDRDLRARVFNWVSNKGPFWNDEREPNQDDYFEYNGRDITDSGLGECARRVLNKKTVKSFSHENDFGSNELIVKQGLPEELIQDVTIDNLWTIEQLEKSAIEALPVLDNWREAIDRLINQFPELKFSPDVFRQIEPIPFTIVTYQKIFERCQVLADYIQSRHNGLDTEKSRELLEKYFRGDRAWFSDSSPSEKRDFKKELSFDDLISGQTCLFGFHGKFKIQNLPIRIHFGWPLKPEDNQVQIVYIGQKLTKR